MDSESDASIVSGTTVHSRNNSPHLTFSLKICENAANTSDYKSPIVPMTISRFQNVIEEPLYCNLGKRKNDEESDAESSYSQSILCNYKPKAFTRAKVLQSQVAVSAERPVRGLQNTVSLSQGPQENGNDNKPSSGSRRKTRETEDQQNEACNEDSSQSKGSRGKTIQTADQRKESRDMDVSQTGGSQVLLAIQTADQRKESRDVDVSQTGGSQVLFPDTQSSSRSMEKQVLPCSQISSDMSTASSKFKELGSDLSKEDMVEAFRKIKKIHTKMEENMKGKDMTEEHRENLKKKLAVVHSSLKNINEKMNYEKVRVTFDAKHCVKTAADKDRLREQMRDLTQRQSTLKELFVKQMELTKHLKQDPGNPAKSHFHEMMASEGSGIYANKVNDWLNRHQTSMWREHSVQHSSLPANKHSKIDQSSGCQSSGCVESDFVASARRSGTDEAQVAQPKTGLAVSMNIESQTHTLKRQQAVPLPVIQNIRDTTSHSGRKQANVIHMSKHLNSNVVSHNASSAATSIPQQHGPVHNPPPPISTSSTMHKDQMKKKKSSQSFKRPSEIIKSPPLFNPDSFLRKTRKSPPVKTTVSSFKSPPLSLLRSAEDRNVSPSTVCSSDVFPVSCRELSRRIQERIESQKEAERIESQKEAERIESQKEAERIESQKEAECIESQKEAERIESQKEAASQQAFQSQMLSTASQTMRNDPLLSQKNGFGDRSREEAPERTVQSQPASRSNANTFANMEEVDEETIINEKYGGLKFPSLQTLIDLDVLFPAERILTVQHDGKVYTSSLTSLGYIESKGGEIFTTPVKWLSAVRGGEVVKKGQAYREILYDGHALKSYVDGEQKTSIEKIRAREQSDTSECIGTANIPPNPKQSKSSKLTEGDDIELAELLYQCKIQLLDKSDLVPMDDLPENFWSSDFSNVHLSYAFWKQIDDWDTSVESLTRQ